MDFFLQFPYRDIETEMRVDQVKAVVTQVLSVASRYGVRSSLLKGQDKVERDRERERGCSQCTRFPPAETLVQSP